MNKPINLNPHDLAILQGLVQAIRPFVRISSRLPLRSVYTFLTVAFEEGQTVGWYARKLGIRPNTMSRNLLDIGPRNRYMEGGYGLIISKDAAKDLRAREYFLTAKGRNLLNEVLKQIRP